MRENHHAAQFAPCIASRWEQSNPDNLPRARHIFHIPFALIDVLNLQISLNDHDSAALEAEEILRNPAHEADINRMQQLVDSFFNEGEMEHGHNWLTRAQEGISAYLREYEVTEKSLDPYKYVYWYALSLVGYFSDSAPAASTVYKQTAQRVLLILMSRLLLADTGRKINEEMEHKLFRSMVEGKDEKNLGEYGIYMIFKNISKLCNECHMHQ
ncbi:MAG: hypothetical protein WC091_04660 [Sulfuricellaceae bacterium]